MVCIATILPRYPLPKMTASGAANVVDCRWAPEGSKLDPSLHTFISVTWHGRIRFCWYGTTCRLGLPPPPQTRSKPWLDHRDCVPEVVLRWRRKPIRSITITRINTILLAFLNQWWLEKGNFFTNTQFWRVACKSTHLTTTVFLYLCSSRSNTKARLRALKGHCVNSKCS